MLFNQSLKKGDIPNAVTYLSFGGYFNQTLKKGIIPNSVTHLSFSDDFNQTLKKDDIPDSVTHLRLGYYFDKDIDYCISNNLIELIVDKDYDISKLKSNKDILIGYLFGNSYILYYQYNINISIEKKIKLDNYVSNMDLNKLKGRLIMKELVEKVFHPTRLLNISNKYNIGFIDLIEIYS